MRMSWRDKVNFTVQTRVIKCNNSNQDSPVYNCTHIHAIYVLTVVSRIERLKIKLIKQNQKNFMFLILF